MDALKKFEDKVTNEYVTSHSLQLMKDTASLAKDFADVEDQGYMPLYKRSKLTDILHEVCGFRTDYQFITRQKMRGIQKRSKGRE